MMARVYAAVLKPASGGFGMWDVGEWEVVPRVRTVGGWMRMAKREQPAATYSVDYDISGRVYGQDGATIVKARHWYPDGGPAETRYAVRVEED